ncbi:putative N-acetylated-alpha-linked acidic dipeptidase [Diadema antillarum]|uniref:putative N-acetylated-alpha-linked acidic dipeptidase n=1 Tax=Diadema antillarum TaxID=105358 RepID=UPI003A84FD8C
MPNQRVIIAVGVSTALAVGIGVGVLIGWFSGPDRVPSSYEMARRPPDESVSTSIMNEMNEESVRNTLMELTRDPHVAGTPQNYKLAVDIKQLWSDYGFEATIHTYNVLLSFPSTVQGENNTIEIVAPNGTAVFTCQLYEERLDDISREKSDEILPPFNAYSANGTFTGDLMYVNYARIEDFQELEDLGYSVSGRIAIARYGKIYRGDKAKFAAQYGALGLILYSDPADYAKSTTGPIQTYPDGIFLPGSGTQRGSCLDGNGDPLTQSYPAVESAYRLPVEESTMLPTIPIHPIGYDDAAQLLSKMDGPQVVSEWRGDLELTYRYGPGFNDSYENMTVKMAIYTKNEMANGWDVIGVIPGAVEPDRYIMIGNHRDAWGFGAIDAGSGTTAMLEISRAMGEQLQRGWTPRRSIMFCSWGAEEQGLIGSTEWVEEFAKNLGVRAVAYLNLDVAMDGTYVPSISATPNMETLIYESAQKIPNPDPTPDEGEETLYDTWKARQRPLPEGDPVIGTLGAGSDYAPFLQIAGISAMDFTYTYDDEETPIASYPTYHSVYETFYLVDELYPNAFKYILAAGRLYAEILRRLADDIVLPLNVVSYAKAVDGYWESLRDGTIGDQMRTGGIKFEYMDSAVANFSSAANAFSERVEGLDTNDVLAVRRINDQLMFLERSFIDPMGLTGRPTTKHVVFAPSSKNAYAGEKFASIVDAMFDIDDNPDPKKWDLVEKELSIVTYLVQSAAYSLGEDGRYGS